jgi:hypothetical protein
MRSSSAVVFVVLCALLAGCPPGEGEGEGEEGEGEAGEGEGEEGEGEGGGEGEGEPADDLDVVCARGAEAVCGGLESCGCSLDGRDFDDAAGCVAQRRAACLENNPLRAALNAGLLALDDAGLDACIASLAPTATCAAPPLTLACRDMWTVDVDVGRECPALGLTELRCADGAAVCTRRCIGESCRDECAVPPGVNTQCTSVCADGLACIDGVCRETGAADQPCNSFFDCDPALSCFAGVCRAVADVGGACNDVVDCAEGLRCAAGVCAAGAPRGASCAGPTCGNGDACVRDYDARACAALRVDGEGCGDNADCESGLCSNARVCAAVPGLNDPCVDNACGGGSPTTNPDTGLTCVDDVCVAAPGVGQPCTIGNAACAPGLGCNVDNVCAVGGGVGDACLIPDLVCGEGLGCDFTAEGRVCATRRGLGAECQSDVCADGLFCDFATATCAARGAASAACDVDASCADGLQCGDLLGGARCQDVPSTSGAPCTTVCDGFACVGDGGVCAPAFCATP